MFDFEQSQNLLNRAENWLDNKKSNYDSMSMSSGKTGQSKGNRDIINKNKEAAGSHNRYIKKRLCDNLNLD